MDVAARRLGIRHVQVAVMAVASCMVYSIRSTLSVAIVAMVHYNSSETNMNSTDLYPVSRPVLITYGIPFISVHFVCDVFCIYVTDLRLGWENAGIGSQFLLLGLLFDAVASRNHNRAVWWPQVFVSSRFRIFFINFVSAFMCVHWRMASGLHKPDASGLNPGKVRGRLCDNLSM